MIHSTAIIDSSAEISNNVKIGPWTYIGPNVKVFSGNIIHNNVTIVKNTLVEEDNEIYPYSVLGSAPQDLKYAGEETELKIGKNNIIREFTTVNLGTREGGGITRINNKNLLMAYSHVAHDCCLGNNIILANNATLAGHVTVLDHAIIGAFCAIHQFCVIGEHSMLSHGVLVNKNVLPFTMVSPVNRTIKASGLNIRGLKRHDFSDIDLLLLKKVYKIIYRQGLTLTEIKEEIGKYKKDSYLIDRFFTFIENNCSRGFI